MTVYVDKNSYLLIKGYSSHSELTQTPPCFAFVNSTGRHPQVRGSLVDSFSYIVSAVFECQTHQDQAVSRDSVGGSEQLFTDQKLQQPQ